MPVELEELEQEAAQEVSTEDLLAAIKEARSQQRDVIEVLQERNLIVSDELFVQALQAFRLLKMYDEVLTLFTIFEGIYTDQVAAYAERLCACEALSRASSVFAVFESMRAVGLQPDLRCFNIVLKVHAHNKSWKGTMRLLEEMKTDEIQPDVQSFDYALSSCPTRKNWDVTLRLLQTMRLMEVRPNLSCYRSAMHALSYSPKWDDALKVYNEMRESGFVPDEDILRYFLRACFNSPFENDAIKVFKELETDSTLILTQVHFDMAINICEASGQWMEVLALASSMGARGVSPHSATCNVVLKACVELGKWEVALKLLETMERDGTDLDPFAYSTVLVACGRAEQWDEVLRLYNELKERAPGLLELDMAFQAITALCQLGRAGDAMLLYREGLQKGLGKRLWQRRRLGSDPVILDARGLSPDSAGIAVRAALEDFVQEADGVAVSSGNARLGALAGFLPTEPSDIVVAVDDESFEGEMPHADSTATGVLDVIKEMMGPDVKVQCARNPFASVKIPGAELQAFLAQRVK
ncbi:unnamed protein product [Polarella glacialis]|nr:unnamed protein product [Polarella glacialis]